MDEKISIHDALVMTINLLGNIAVPRNLNEQIGIPIDNAIGNLKVCANALKVKEKEQTDGNDHAE